MVQKFVREYTFIIEPLTQLTKKDEAFTWLEIRNQAFNKVKEILASEPVLKLPDFEKNFEVIVDITLFLMNHNNFVFMRRIIQPMILNYWQ